MATNGFVEKYIHPNGFGEKYVPLDKSLPPPQAVNYDWSLTAEFCYVDYRLIVLDKICSIFSVPF